MQKYAKKKEDRLGIEPRSPRRQSRLNSFTLWTHAENGLKV